ncbi:MAG: phage protease [Terriglobia bacterium]
MAQQDYATVNGTKVHRSDFAYAPAGSEPSEWKLPIHDANHVRNALARFNQTELPEGAKAAALAKIKRAAAKFGIDVKEKSAEHGIPVLLQDLGAPVATPEGVTAHAAAAQLREIAVAVPGSWVKGDHRFSISKEDLDDMARNFEKRKNDMIVIDYEHASEQPEVAKGGPVPGAGWIHGLSANGKLTALVEWTPQAEEMLRTGQYRFFSPAIDWGATDKETGKPQGATLTSGALTNHPILEELPPIMLSDGVVIEAVYNRLTNGAQAAPLRLHEGETTMKKLNLRPIPEGEEGSGHHAVVDRETGETVGLIPHGELTEYVANHLGVNPDAEQDEDEDTTARRSEAQTLRMEAHEAQRRTFFLSEAVRKGKIDNQRASALADAGKITLTDYIRAQEAEKLLESAVTAGKILPRDRGFFFRDALDRPKEFLEFIRGASPVVRWGANGIGSAEVLQVDEEIDLGVKRLMSEKGFDYAKALRQFLAAHPGLGEQYRRKHTYPTAAEAPSQ